MRDLLLSELHQVNGGSVQADLSSVLTQGLSNKEINFIILSLGTGVAIGAVIPWPWGLVAGVTLAAGWVGFDMFVMSKDNTATTTVAVTATTTAPAATVGRGAAL